MRKSVSLLLVAVMALTVFFGVMPALAEESSLFNVGALPIVNEPVTLKILSGTSSEYPVSKAGIWDWLSEQSGIKFEIECYTSDEMSTKMALILATNDRPDIIWQAGLDESATASYGANGILLKLNDYIEQYGTYTKQVFAAHSDALAAASCVDGSIYSLPAYNYNRKQNVNAIIVNKNWLANVGKEVPTTTEEFYEMLKAFKEQDADGDGNADNEIPTVETDSPNTFLFKSLMGAFGMKCMWPVTGCLYDNDAEGNVYLCQTSENFKALMKYMNKLYDEGLIDNDSYTMSTDERTAKWHDGQYGCYPQLVEYSDGEGDSFNPNDWAVLPPLTSEVNATPLTAALAQYQTNMGSICADSEYPEVAFLFLDWCYSPDVSYLYNCEKSYIVPDATVSEAAKSVIAAFSGDDGVLDDDERKTRQHWINYYGPRWQRLDWVDVTSFEPITQEYIEVMTGHGEVDWQYIAKYTEEETEVVGTYETDLGAVLDEWRLQFITGKKNVDETWDEYVALVNSLHADELVAVYQGCYDRYIGK